MTGKRYWNEYTQFPSHHNSYEALKFKFKYSYDRDKYWEFFHVQLPVYVLISVSSFCQSLAKPYCCNKIDKSHCDEVEFYKVHEQNSLLVPVIQIISLLKICSRFKMTDISSIVKSCFILIFLELFKSQFFNLDYTKLFFSSITVFDWMQSHVFLLCNAIFWKIMSYLLRTSIATKILHALQKKLRKFAWRISSPLLMSMHVTKIRWASWKIKYVCVYGLR